MMRRLAVLVLVYGCCSSNNNVNAFQCSPQTKIVTNTKLWSQQSNREPDRHLADDDLVSPAVVSRKRWIHQCLSIGFGAVSSSMALTNDPVNAAPDNQKDTMWLTGKDPVVPGQAKRDKNDVKGTRKDPNFLRSISDCKNQCENSTGPDGLARTKEECLSDCQDICCQTYQQCTFGIVPRI